MAAGLKSRAGFAPGVASSMPPRAGANRYASADGYCPQLQFGSVSTSVRLVNMEGDQISSQDDLLPGESYDILT
jgi:hypothetical protein